MFFFVFGMVFLFVEISRRTSERRGKIGQGGKRRVGKTTKSNSDSVRGRFEAKTRSKRGKSKRNKRKNLILRLTNESNLIVFSGFQKNKIFFKAFNKKDLTLKLLKEQEDLEKNMTLKRERKREDAKRALLQMEQEATANLVTKHSEEMLKLIKAKEAEEVRPSFSLSF